MSRGRRVEAVIAILLASAVACGGAVAGDARDDSRCSRSADPTCSCAGTPFAGTRACDDTGHWASCRCAASVPVTPPTTSPPAPTTPKPAEEAGDTSDCAGDENVLVYWAPEADNPYHRRLAGTPAATFLSASSLQLFLNKTELYFIEISTERLGIPLGVGVYKDAVDLGRSTDVAAGWSTNFGGSGCSDERTTLWIHEFQRDGDKLTRLLLAWDGTCTGVHIRGCLLYRPDPPDAGADGGM